MKGTQTILIQDDFAYSKDQDYLISVEAIGSSLRVYQDEALIFDVKDEDEAMRSGQIGLYSWANATARFSETIGEGCTCPSRS